MNLSDLLKNFGGNFSEEISKILASVNEETVAPLSALFNVKAETLLVFLRLIPKILAGEIDLKNVIPALIPTFIEYYLTLNRSQDNKKTTAPVSETIDLEEDIRFIGNGAINSLDVYLQSKIASE